VRIELSRQDREVEGWGDRPSLKGMVEALSEDSLTLQVHPSATPMRISMNGIHRLDVSRGVGRWRTALHSGFGAALATTLW
jgi:hypothetical protein